MLTRPEDIEPFLVDHRGLYRGAALAVVQPSSTEEVSRLLAWCNEARVGVVPQGGNTGYCGGATPDPARRDIVLSMRRLNRYRSASTRRWPRATVSPPKAAMACMV